MDGKKSSTNTTLSESAVWRFFKSDSVDSEKVYPRSTNVEAQAYINRVNNLTSNDKGYVGQPLPYKWQALHLLPMTCFMKVFDPTDLSIIHLSNYDINTGKNIIFLPARKKLTKHHKLPYYSSNPINYNDEIIEEFKEIKQEIEKKKKSGEPHKNIAIEIKKMLHEFEEERYAHIISLGQTRLN